MFAHLDDDTVVFSKDNDDSLQINWLNYVNSNDEESKKLKKSFFAVIVHGLADSVVPGFQDKEMITWDFDNFAQKLKYAWAEKGNGRAILMLSCFMGYGMARPLARRLKKPMVAARSAVSISSNGLIQTLQMSEASRNPKNQNLHTNNRLDWVLVTANGQIEILNKSILDKTRAVEFAEKQKF